MGVNMGENMNVTMCEILCPNMNVTMVVNMNKQKYKWGVKHA